MVPTRATSRADKTLETQLVTRVFPDPASDVGLSNGISIIGNHEMGQVMAIIYIPDDTDADINYTLWARKKIGGQTLETLEYSEAFEVLPKGPQYVEPPYEKTPRTAKWTGWDLDNAVGYAYPHPKLLVHLPAAPLPSAAEIVIHIKVPAQTEILGVFEEQHFGRESVILCNCDDVNNGVTDQLTINFVNAESSPTVHMLAIAYEPGPGYSRINDQNVLPGGVSISNYFSVFDQTYWDANGVEITGVAATLGPVR